MTASISSSQKVPAISVGRETIPSKSDVANGQFLAYLKPLKSYRPKNRRERDFMNHGYGMAIYGGVTIIIHNGDGERRRANPTKTPAKSQEHIGSIFQFSHPSQQNKQCKSNLDITVSLQASTLPSPTEDLKRSARVTDQEPAPGTWPNKRPSDSKAPNAFLVRESSSLCQLHSRQIRRSRRLSGSWPGDARLR